MLTLLLVMAAMVVLGTWLCPHAPLSHWVHRYFVVPLADRVSRLTMRKTLILGVLVAALITLAPVMPLELVFAAVGDVSLYIELIALIGASAAVLRSRDVNDAITSSLRQAGRFARGTIRPIRMVPRTASRIARAIHLQSKPSVSVDEEGGVAFA